MGGSVEEKEEEEGEFIETDADACHFFESGSGEGELFFISAIRAVKLSIVFSASCQRAGAVLLWMCSHTYTRTL